MSVCFLHKHIVFVNQVINVFPYIITSGCRGRVVLLIVPLLKKPPNVKNKLEYQAGSIQPSLLLDMQILGMHVGPPPL